MTKPFVVVGCGNWKHEEPRPAADLYRSTYIRSAVAWARQYTDAEHLLILSAKHGLIAGTAVIEPYSATFSSPRGFAAGSGPLEPPIALYKVARQVSGWGLRGAVPVLAGKTYLRLLTDASRGAVHPFNPFADAARARWNDGRLGYQMKLMKENPGRLPDQVVPTDKEAL